MTESPLRSRKLPESAPEHIHFDSRLVVKKLRQSDDMILYVNYIEDQPTFIFVMSAYDPATALSVTDFLVGRRALLVADRDGVVKDSTFLNSTESEEAEGVMIPSALEAGRRLNDAGVALAIATNQGGYQSGHMRFDEMIAINVRVSQQMAEAGGRLDAILICPFYEPLPDPGPGVFDARKPAGGMPLFARHLADAAGVPTLAMVGDQRTDGVAGQAAGLKFFAVTDKNGRWQAELESARKHGETLPTLDTDPDRYQEVPAFADVVEILLAEEPPPGPSD